MALMALMTLKALLVEAHLRHLRHVSVLRELAGMKTPEHQFGPRRFASRTPPRFFSGTGWGPGRLAAFDGHKVRQGPHST